MALQFENAGIENKKIKVLKNYCELVQVNRELKPGKRLLFLSNITVEKGVFDAIALFEKIKKKHPDSTLDIAGSSFLTDVQMQLFQSKVNDIDGVVYHGSIQGELKENILEQSDILIFPSKYKTEASPLVLLEAMSYGLAVVLYKHNNIEEVLPSQDYAIENYSFKSMVLKTNRLLKDSDIQTKYRVECLKESKK
ncbi:glycosyltransferase family 4 protein, partial [Vibrio sp. 10N.222.54.B11]